MTDNIDDILNSGICRAVDKAGGVSALARKLDVSRAVIYTWLQQRFVPLERAVEIESQYAIPRRDLIDPKLWATVTGQK